MPIPFNQLYRTLIAATLATLLLSAPMMGISLPFLAFAQVLCIPWLIWIYFKRPERWKAGASRFAIWLLASLTIFGAHFARYKMARAYADSVVASVNAFMSAHARCPASLEEAGLSSQALRDRLLMAGYSCNGQQPHPQLFYSVGFAPFAMYHYNFDGKEWYMVD